MTPKLVKELREALQDNKGKPVEIEDAQMRQVYVLMTQEDFRRLVYDDSELDAKEMQAAAGSAFRDPEGWGAPEMESYDHDDLDHSKS